MTPVTRVKRAFSGRLVGLPPDESVVAAPVSGPNAVVQAQQIVATLLDAVQGVTARYAPERDEQVRQAVRQTFSPSEKRRRGRPQKYAGVTVEERERNRKRVERARAKNKLTKLLAHFELQLDSTIPPGLKQKYGINVDSYRELLGSERVEAKVLKEITAELKMIGAIPNPSPLNKKTGLPLMSNGQYLADAPEGKGKLILSGKPETIHGVRQQQDSDLSRPKDQEELLDIPESLLGNDELPTGDRRKVRPKGNGPDDSGE